MNLQELIDRFCDSPRRWLIVTGATFLVALATVLPQVDQYLSLRAEIEEQREQLAEAEQTATQLPHFRQTAKRTGAELGQLEDKTLPAQRVAAFRSQLVDLVRESGCQVRRIGVGNVRTRNWRENDHPLADSKANGGKKTPFELETRPVSLSVTGGMNELRDLFARIEKHGMMMHAHSIDLRPTGRNSRVVQMEIELWCFALTRGGGRA